MISIIITSFKEPKTIGKAIDSIAKQDFKEDYELYIVAPDDETLNVAKSYAKKNKKIKIFRDPGKGKSYALNQVIKKVKGRIIVLTDGDVYVSSNSIKEFIKEFEDKKVGCVTGRPVSTNDRNSLLGYWSHLLCDAGAHEARSKRMKRNEFLECSGYLWAFRSGIIKDFPLDVAEDSIVPYLFAEKEYKISYVPKAEVYVKYPTTFKDFIEQKKRTAKSHEGLNQYVDTKKIPRTKSFKNEVKEGWRAFLYPISIKEFLWTLLLFGVRLYIWIVVFYHIKIKDITYNDAWKRVETTK